MKGISGVIGGVVVIILLLVVVSITLAAMNYTYGVQQLEGKIIMSQLSQPHVAQVSPDSVMTSGRLVASYIIYPDGRIAFLNMAVSGIKGFQSYLDGSPWAVVVFSNGQWINVTNANIGSNGFGILGTGSYLVPYYPGIFTGNYTQLASIMYNGTRYNTPLYYQVNATFLSAYYNATSGNTIYSTTSVVANPSNPLVFSTGRILEVPVTSEDGWLNFTAVSVNDGGICFAVLVPNTTGDIIVIEFYLSSNYRINWSPAYYSHPDVLLTSGAYGIYQFINNPINISFGYIPVFYKSGYVLPGTPLVLNPNMSYAFNNASIPYTPIVKVALKFSQGQPAQMYLWYGYYNGSGISWKRLFLPGFNVPTGTLIGYSEPIIKEYTYSTYNSLGQHYVSPWPYIKFLGYTPANWIVSTEPSWPVNIYSENVIKSTYIGNPPGGFWATGIYAEPLDPQPGSDILVIPFTYYYYTRNINTIYPVFSGTAIVNVAYSI